MDGTATGILGTLPNFKRPVSVVEAVKRLSELQYIMRSPRYQLFADSVLVYAKKNEGKNRFEVKFPKKLWNSLQVIYNTVFESNANTQEKNGVDCVRSFLQSCYQLKNADGSNSERSSVDSEMEHIETGKCDIVLGHKFRDVDIRRTSVEFGRCFATGSIPGFFCGSQLHATLQMI